MKLKSLVAIVCLAAWSSLTMAQAAAPAGGDSTLTPQTQKRHHADRVHKKPHKHTHPHGKAHGKGHGKTHGTHNPHGARQHHQARGAH